MASTARWLAIGGSLGLHAAVAALALVFAREPVHRALQPAGAVEVGVVFTEPPLLPAPGSEPSSTKALVPSGPSRAPAPQRAAAAPPHRATPPPAPPKPEPEPEPEPAAPAPPAGAPSVLAVEPAGTSGAVPVPAPGPAEGAEAPAAGASASAEGGGGGAGASGGTGGGAGLAGGGAGGGGGGLGPDVDEELRRRLAQSAARCYPRAARRFRAEGTARVRFCVGEDGGAREEQIVESSGQSLLDEAALRCVVARAAPFPRTAACFTVPVHFYVP